MSILDLRVEIDGIVGTIAHYSMNPYLNGYTTSLRKAIEEKDLDLAKVSISKLLQWYEANMDSIENNQYISNKQDHVKTKSLLENAFDAIQKGDFL